MQSVNERNGERLAYGRCVTVNFPAAPNWVIADTEHVDGELVQRIAVDTARVRWCERRSVPPANRPHNVTNP